MPTGNLWAQVGAGGGGGGGGTVTYAQINAALGLPASVFMFSNAASEVVGYTQWSLDETTKFSNVQLTYQPNNLSANVSAHYWNTNIDPLQNSPNDLVTVHSFFANLDSAATGFDLGTNGDSVHLINGGANNLGNGGIYGRIRYSNFYSTIGNGTDPTTLKGLTGYSSAMAIAANATVDGNFTGYDFNLNVNASAITTSNFSMSVFSDFSQIAGDLYGYQGLLLSPTIDTIKNTHNFTGINLNPTITDFEGNAGFFGIAIGGQITNQSASNGYYGISLSPQITHLTQNSNGILVGGTTTDGTADWTGVNINPQSVTTTGIVRGLQISALDTQLAIESTGHHNLSSAFDLVSGQGQMYGNVIGGEIRVPAATAITGTDTLANNMAYTVNTGSATSSVVAASLVGITTLGFVGQMIGDGAVTGGVTFCLNGYSDARTGGNIDRTNNFTAAAIPAGAGGTMTEAVLFYGTMPFGAVATDNWGLRIEDDLLENYLPSLAIGTANKKVTNASVGLELDSTTKALLNARMDETERDALTAVDGMQVYNTDSKRLEVYNNDNWLQSVIFSQTASQTVANTVTTTTLFGSGVGTLTLPANFFRAGKTIRLTLMGYHSSTGNPNITVAASLGGTSICTTGAVASGNGASNAWLVNVEITCRTTGATGTVIGSGVYSELQGSGRLAGIVATATTTIDTTASQAIDVTITWGTAAAGNTITATVATVEQLN
jgi:hypothetical protein